MKKTIYFLFPALLIGSLTLVQCKSDSNTNDDTEKEQDESASIINIEHLSNAIIQEAVAYKNLEVYLVTGETTAENVEYVPLNRAMSEDWVKVTETSNVNELKVSNASKHTVFIHAGDIVKGGKQDRTLTYDMIVEPNSKDIELPSFCVESDRWSQRSEEEVAAFSSNTKMLSSRDLKISSKKNKQQTEVWSEVAETQSKLTDNVSKYYNKNVDVQANMSSSSLELALDNEDLKALQKEYLEQFKGMDLSEAIGFAYAINGELYNVDIYNNRALFKELFDKLITAAIVEAIAELDVDEKEFARSSLDMIKSQLSLMDDVNEVKEKLNNRTRWEMLEDDSLVVFTSIDLKNEKKWLHQNVIVKDEDLADNRDDLVIDEMFLRN